MEKLFVATVQNSNGVVKRKFLIKAFTMGDAVKKFTELNIKESEVGEPLHNKNQTVYYEPVEFEIPDIVEI